VGNVLVDQEQARSISSNDEAVVELAEWIDLVSDQAQILCRLEQGRPALTAPCPETPKAAAQLDTDRRWFRLI
jgi:hypothetical protein